MARKPASVAKRAAAGKKSSKKTGFKINQFIVYPAHGVGEVTGIEREVIAGFDVEVYVISFKQDKMTLRVPTAKAATSGMRALSNKNVLKDAFTTLEGRARIKRTMWSRRAQEYEAKINSGDLILVAEVVRDLHRGETQAERSYSERRLYERALDRMTREVAAIKSVDRGIALDEILNTLIMARTRRATKTVTALESENDNDVSSDEAAA